MAAGGTFTTQNKVLPGAYINFVSKARALGNLGERGIVAVAYEGGWGKTGEVVRVSLEDFQKNCFSIFGYNYNSDEMQFLREIFIGANEALVYRISSGTKASAVIGTGDNALTVTAINPGTRGNDIKIVIENDIDTEGNFIVKTIVDTNTTSVDEQSISNFNELINNDFVLFNGQGKPTVSLGTNLSGGSELSAKGSDYSEFLDKIEAYDFTTICYAGEDNTTKALFTSFTKRLRDDEGYKISCVLYDYPQANHEGIISVKNTKNAVYWVAGKTAGAEVNESLTNTLYDGELEFNGNYKKSQLKNIVENGEFVFYNDKKGCRVLKDINSFTEFSSDKNSDFSNNQVIRVLDAIANDTARIFNDYYLGKQQNNSVGRDIFKTELVKYHETLQAIEAITNFDPTNITVEKGTEKGDVIVSEFVEPVGAMDKLYMTCVVE